ncbi:hypothetical protein ACS0TY_010254 [Phlomoides rotata]
MWMESDKCKEVVEYAWNNRNKDASFKDRTSSCGTHLWAWEEDEFGNIGKRLRKAKEKLAELQQKPHTRETVSIMNELDNEIEDLMKLEEMMWFQRSRVFWLKDGDRNTTFFHKKASHRRQRNIIDRIRNVVGVWVEEEEEIVGVMRDFFKDLFSSDGTSHMDQCPLAIQSWGQSPIRFNLQQAMAQSFKTFCWDMFDSLPQAGRGLFVLLLWNIWTARNELYFQKRPSDPGRVVMRALRQFAETDIRSTQGGRKSKALREPVRWTRPPPGTTKINTDAAIFEDGTVGLGFIVRDDMGQTLIAGSKRCRGSDSSTLVEALALKFGLKTAQLGGLLVNIIESDSERLVRTINGDTDDEPYVMSLVDDIKLLAQETQCSIVQHANRTANKVAHFLAHFRKDANFEEIWTDRVPTCCMKIILNDVRREPTSSYE